MEILAFVIVAFVVILIIGSWANARPVSSWSDEKLQRMYGKLLGASTAQSNSEKSKEYFQKAQEVKKELEARKIKSAEKLATKLADDLQPTIQLATQRSLEVIQKTMTEQKVDFEHAHEIVGNRLKETKKNILLKE
jgi:F0F1-type ATP synthase membrane subunit b/b'